MRQPMTALPKPVRGDMEPLLTAPFWLAVAAVALAILRGGMLYDRIAVSPEMTGEFELLAVPLTMLLCAVALVWTFWDDRRRWVWTAPLYITGLFLLWCALSLVQSDYLYASVAALMVTMTAIILAAVFSRAVRTPVTALCGVAVLVGAATVVAGIGLNEFIRTWRDTGDLSWRVFATFTNPDFLAGFLVMTTVISAALFLSVENRSLMMLTGLALFLQAGCLLVTQSRLGVAAAMLAFLSLALLAWRSGALKGTVRRRALFLAGLGLITTLAAAGPILRRFRAAGGESHSMQFRLYTWQGARRMSADNPLLGTGIGTFPTAYQRYAVVGFTQHAHNSFLQLAGETGLPGALLLLASLGAVLGTGTAALKRSEMRGNGPDTISSSRLLLCGLLSAIVGTVMHNLFDSDLYIPSNAVTLGAVCGLSLAHSRQLIPAPMPPGEQVSSRSFRPSPILRRILAIVAACLLAYIAFRTIQARLLVYGAESALRNGDATGAAGGYASAASVEPGNPEHHLSLALLYQSMKQPDAAEREYRMAMKAAPIGKVYFRYGRFLSRTDRWNEAVNMFVRARRVEPNNLQNLLALADAYRATSRDKDAEIVYQEMTMLERTPVGTVRAVPEIPAWEFGAAHTRLAEIATGRSQWTEVEREAGRAVEILGEFWHTRRSQMGMVSVSAETRRTATVMYDQALSLREQALRRLDRIADAQAARQEIKTFRAERDSDPLYREMKPLE